MKKVFALLLTLTLCVGLLSACGSQKTDTPAAPAASSESSKPAAAGEVYYLNFKPEQDEAWQNLAKAYTVPTLTTLIQPQASMGGEAVRILLDMIERGAGNRHVRVDTTLRIGGSVAPLN